MVFVAQTLRVFRNIEAAFFQRSDVIALRGKGDQAKLLTPDTQRIAFEQLSTQSLQLSTGDPFDGIRTFQPVRTRVLRASASPITSQASATGMAARARCR